MTIAQVQVYRYTLPFTESLPFKDNILTQREGLIIRAQSADGREGLGEVAPLPGFSRETLKEATAICTDWATRLQGETLPLKPIELAGGEAPWAALPPSVQFGLSTVAAMLKRREDVTPSGLFGRKARDEVSLNALLLGSREDMIRQAQEAVEAGHRAVKMKVGRTSISDSIASVHAVHEALDGQATLRLDANGAWHFRDAEAFALGVTGTTIEFIEEPLDYWKLLFSFRLYTRMDYAVDETLQLHGLQQTQKIDDEEAQHMRQTLKRARAHIIKPTLFGGLRRVTNFIHECTAPWNCYPVISSSFESGLGLILLANLAAVLDTSDIPVGLDTQRWFAEDVLPEPIPVESGRIQLAKANALINSIDFDRFEKVAET
jgi:O-succinylbenzoate synthase